jgi:hypothetical protein
VVVYNRPLPILAQVVERLTVEVIDVEVIDVYVINVEVINRSQVRIQQIGKVKIIGYTISYNFLYQFVVTTNINIHLRFR